MPSKETRENLNDLLAQRNDSPQLLSEIDQAIWNKFGCNRTVMIIDLSGFTKLSQEYGIIHFLALYQRAAVISRIVLPKHSGIVLKAVADNILALFDTVENALRGAIAFNKEVATVNKDRPVQDRIQLCTGISAGEMILFDDDVYGHPVNIAYKLGEDIAGPAEILIANEAWQRLDPNAAAEFRAEPQKEVITGGVSISYCKLLY